MTRGLQSPVWGKRCHSESSGAPTARCRDGRSAGFPLTVRVWPRAALLGVPRCCAPGACLCWGRGPCSPAVISQPWPSEDTSRLALSARRRRNKANWEHTTRLTPFASRSADGAPVCSAGHTHVTQPPVIFPNLLSPRRQLRGRVGCQPWRLRVEAGRHLWTRRGARRGPGAAPEQTGSASPRPRAPCSFVCCWWVTAMTCYRHTGRGWLTDCAT